LTKKTNRHRHPRQAPKAPDRALPDTWRKVGECRLAVAKLQAPGRREHELRPALNDLLVAGRSVFDYLAAELGITKGDVWAWYDTWNGLTQEERGLVDLFHSRREADVHALEGLETVVDMKLETMTLSELGPHHMVMIGNLPNALPSPFPALGRPTLYVVYPDRRVEAADEGARYVALLERLVAAFSQADAQSNHP